MSAHIAQMEKKIDSILETGFAEKHNVTTKVSEITELDYKSFSELKSDMFSGDVIVRMAPGSIGEGTFSVFATGAQQLANMILGLSVYALPIIGIALGIFVSYWWFLLLLSPIFTLVMQKKVYLAALFNAVGVSEKAFCFAFCGNAITVENRDGNICYRGMAGQ